MTGSADTITQTRTLSRRTFLRAAATTAAVPAGLSLAGCGGSDGGSTKGALSFVYMGDAEQQDQFEKLFAEFNKVHPEIELDAQGIPSGNWATFANTVSTRIAGGQVPDIVQIATEGQRIFASKGLLEPLDDFIAQDKKLVDDYFADINPNLVKWNTEYASHDGQTYYMPGGFNTMCLYVNTEIFAAAGVEIPAEGTWTWDEFAAAGERIKQKTGAFLIPANSGYFTDVMPWLTTNGTSPLNADWSAATLDSPEAAEAAAFVRDLVEAGLAPEPGGQFDAPSQMKQGKLATLGGGRWPVIDLRRLGLVEKTMVMAWPTRTGHGSPIGWDAWPIMKASKNKEDAWTFLKFLISKEAASFFATLGGTIVPARRSVAASPDFLDNAPAHSERLSEAVSYATPIPSPDRGAECQQVIEEAWLKVLSGNGAADETLAAANEKLGTLL
ncbi:carbohydrate ABC transporter substrate-binding protein (CUT1 family) [Haloactinopolyspora alba]|uniref:Carbohydrate ABC transporter substrate-binding protein (CUT1 family) n=1 Tax=Haloactinopolyspora alba TaxID=648780 RepID=A0A2P8E6U0_9ACTN|nr:sugar ABC transporter substrate-binding protein [Haloactinopolyspora alba]PSL05148.1 carbohydrate ABC transporter substrate-binding protein (CUT1 family) [Haloactinopolyspora alba]